MMEIGDVVRDIFRALGIDGWEEIGREPQPAEPVPVPPVVQSAPLLDTDTEPPAAARESNAKPHVKKRVRNSAE